MADRTINDSNWHHLAVCFTAGSQELSDVSIYVDGEPSETSVSFNLDPSTYGPSLWLDATDVDGDEITDIPSSGPISSWNDKSGNNSNATQSNSNNQPTLTSSTLNGKPVVSFDGTDDYLSSAGLNITQPYSIFCCQDYKQHLGRDYLFDGLEAIRIIAVWLPLIILVKFKCGHTTLGQIVTSIRPQNILFYLQFLIHRIAHSV